MALHGVGDDGVGAAFDEAASGWLVIFFFLLSWARCDLAVVETRSTDGSWWTFVYM